MIYQSFFALAADKAKNISRKVTIGNESEIKDLVSSDLPDNNFLFKSNNPLNPAINITLNHKRKKYLRIPSIGDQTAKRCCSSFCRQTRLDRR